MLTDEEELVVEDEDEEELEVLVVVSTISPHEGEEEVPIFSKIELTPLVPSVFTKRQPWEYVFASTNLLD